MKDIVFVSDFTYKDFQGGAEMYDRVLRKELTPEVKFVYSNQLTVDVLNDIEGKTLLLSNFSKLPSKARHKISENFEYYILEHDYKFCRRRNPAKWDDYIVPDSAKMNLEFLRSANKVMCQSELQKGVYDDNVPDVDTMSLGGTLFDKNVIEYLANKSENRRYNYGVVDYSDKRHKGKEASIEYCQEHNLTFHLISRKPYERFLDSLARHHTLVLIPQWPEPFNRLYAECKMMGMRVTTDGADIGAEKYLKGLGRQETIQKAIGGRTEVVNRIEQEIL
jgi:hypothetical protein